MKVIWDNYLKKHTEIQNQFRFDLDSNNYFISFSFKINPTGSVSFAGQRVKPDTLTAFCISIYKELFQKSTWQASKKIMKNGKKMSINTLIEVRFHISKNKISKISLEDLTAYKTIFSCN